MGSPTKNKREEQKVLILSDGKVVPVRTIQSGDAAALHRFHGRLSE